MIFKLSKKNPQPVQNLPALTLYRVATRRLRNTGIDQFSQLVFTDRALFVVRHTFLTLLKTLLIA
jgi:hypothetical protein